jgi:GNAT superfamily N-acetyltransferase
MIRKAMKSDLDAVVNIYDEIHQAEEAGIISVGWIRGIYPVKETAEEALKRDDLFVIEKDGIVLGSGIINKIQVDVYKNAKWEHEVEEDKVCVLHTLTISPRAGKKGLGKQFVSFYEDYALENGCSELRIDTNERNMAARKMYSKLGYKEVAIVPTVFNGIPDVNLVLLEKYMG